MSSPNTEVSTLLLQILTLISGLCLLMAATLLAFDQDTKEINPTEEPNVHPAVTLEVDSSEPLPELETVEVLS